MSDGGANTSAETVTRFPNYAAASVASCQLVNSGSQKVDPKKLVLYPSRLQVSPAYGKIVGVGVPSGQSVTPYIRLDMEPKNADPKKDKGIHFNAIKLSDSSVKLAAVIQSSVALDDKARTDLYMQYVKALENRSAEFIWDWWRTGVAG